MGVYYSSFRHGGNPLRKETLIIHSKILYWRKRKLIAGYYDIMLQSYEIISIAVNETILGANIFITTDIGNIMARHFSKNDAHKIKKEFYLFLGGYSQPEMTIDEIIEEATHPNKKKSPPKTLSSVILNNVPDVFISFEPNRIDKITTEAQYWDAMARIEEIAAEGANLGGMELLSPERKEEFTRLSDRMGEWEKKHGSPFQSL